MRKGHNEWKGAERKEQPTMAEQATQLNQTIKAAARSKTNYPKGNKPTKQWQPTRRPH